MSLDLRELLESGSDLFGDEMDAKVLAVAAPALYEQFVGKYRPLLAALPAVAEQVGKDAVPVVVSVMKVLNTVMADSAMGLELEARRQQRAKSRFADLSAYKAAGFTRAEAMALVLADITASAGVQQRVSSAVGSAKARS